MPLDPAAQLIIDALYAPRRNAGEAACAIRAALG